MPLKEAWVVSPDRRKKFKHMLETNKMGEPIIASKCFLLQQGAHGFLIVSNKGIAWSEKTSLTGLQNLSFGTSSKWVRWHDVVTINPLKRPGDLAVDVNKRKNGVLLKNKKGTPKTKVLTFRIKQNQNEMKILFEQRKAEFFEIMKELFYQYKKDENPPTSDSRT